MHKSSGPSTTKGSSDPSHSYTSLNIKTQNTLDEENITLSSSTAASTATTAASTTNEISLEHVNALLSKENDDLKQSRLMLFWLLLVAIGLLFIETIQMNHIANSQITQQDQGQDRPMHHYHQHQHQHQHQHPWPHMGRKLQINASAFTANDYECLQLDTGNWPSERVHCELKPGVDTDTDTDLLYDFVVEHFDDEHCQHPNEKLPTVRHTSSGCFYYEKYNHSYHDLCHMNRTFTVSAFEGVGCLVPLNVTAVNLLPEDMDMDMDIDVDMDTSIISSHSRTKWDGIGGF